MPSKRQKKKKQGEAAKGSSTPQTRIQSSNKPADEAQTGSKSEEPIEQPIQTGPVSKPAPPIVKNVQDQSVSLKLQKSPTGVTVKYRVEYKEVQSDSGAEEKEPWIVEDTTDEDFTLTGLKSGGQYLIRYRTVDEVGVSEPSDTVNVAFSAQDENVPKGGNGGNPFSFKCNSSSISKIKVTFSQTNLCTIEATFGTGRLVKVGNSEGSNAKTFTLDKNDQIVGATLWPNSQNNMCAGLEFMVANSNTGRREPKTVKCNTVGNPVSVDVKSGKCYGITGRNGEEIDALGLCFM